MTKKNTNHNNSHVARELAEHTATHAVGHAVGHAVAGSAGGLFGGFFAGITHVGTLNPREEVHLPPADPNKIRKVTQEINAQKNSMKHR